MCGARFPQSARLSQMARSSLLSTRVSPFFHHRRRFTRLTVMATAIAPRCSVLTSFRDPTGQTPTSTREKWIGLFFEKWQSLSQARMMICAPLTSQWMKKRSTEQRDRQSAEPFGTMTVLERLVRCATISRDRRDTSRRNAEPPRRCRWWAQSRYPGRSR